MTSSKPLPKCVFDCKYPLEAQTVESACSVGDPGSIPGLGRSLGEGNGNPLQYACLEKPMDGGTWQATVHGVAKSRIRLSNFAHFDSITKVIYNTDISL